MTALALNPASAPPGPASTASAAGQAADPAAGFEALLSSLFPQGAAPGTTTVTPASDKGGAEDTSDPLPEEVAVDAAGTSATPSSGDANAALLASAFPVQTLIAGNAAGNGAEQGHAFGRDKGKGVPAAPALLNANPNAGLLDKAAAAEQVLVGSTAASEGRRTTPASEASARASAQAQAAGSAQSARLAAPAIPDIPDGVGAVPPTATVDSNDSPNTPVPIGGNVADTLTTTLAAAGGAVRPEPAPAPRSTRADRNRGTTEAGSADQAPAGKGPAATAAPTAAVAAASIGQSADAGSEATEDKTGEAEVAADSPDGTVQAEARSAAQSLASTAPGAQGVRGSPETVATLAAQIIKKLEGQSTRFDLELNPAGLGKVDVRIDIGSHGRISAAMMFDNPAAAADLRARATELQRMLEQAGFDLSGGLSFDVAGDRGQQQRHAWQDQNDNAGHAFRGQAFRAALDTAGYATDAAIEGALRLRRGINAGLDLRI